MKYYIKPAMLAMIFLVSIDGMAQEHEKETMPPAERAAKLTAWMKTNLQLTAEQEKPIHEINLKYANKTEELRNSNEARAQKFKKIKRYNEEKDNELKVLFTADQFKTYEAKKEELKEEFKAKAREKKKDQQ